MKEKGKEPGWWWVVLGIGSAAAFPATVVAVTEDSGRPEKKCAGCAGCAALCASVHSCGTGCATRSWRQRSAARPSRSQARRRGSSRGARIPRVAERRTGSAGATARPAALHAVQRHTVQYVVQRMVRSI